MLTAIEENDIKKLESVLIFANPNSTPGVHPSIEVFGEIFDRQTPLMAACEKGSFEMVKLLVENGADVNYKRLNAQISPLNYAVQSKSIENLEIVRYLINKGADIHYPNYKNDQPAYNLMSCHTLPPNGMEILKVLMEAGVDSENEMLLHVACYWKHEEAIRFLVEEYGYDACDPYYLCAYCYGVENYSYETFGYFLERGANPYAKDEDGKCAMDYLRENSPEWAEKLETLAKEYGFEE